MKPKTTTQPNGVLKGLSLYRDQLEKTIISCALLENSFSHVNYIISAKNFQGINQKIWEAMATLYPSKPISVSTVFSVLIKENVKIKITHVGEYLDSPIISRGYSYDALMLLEIDIRFKALDLIRSMYVNAKNDGDLGMAGVYLEIIKDFENPLIDLFESLDNSYKYLLGYGEESNAAKVKKYHELVENKAKLIKRYNRFDTLIDNLEQLSRFDQFNIPYENILSARRLTHVALKCITSHKVDSQLYNQIQQLDYVQ